MSNKLLITKDKITAIADAIRNKLDVSTTYTLDEMPPAIEGFKTDDGLDYVLQVNGKEQTMLDLSKYDTDTIPDGAFTRAGTETRFDHTVAKQLCQGLVLGSKIKTVGQRAFERTGVGDMINAPALETVKEKGFYGTFQKGVVQAGNITLNAPNLKTVEANGLAFSEIEHLSPSTLLYSVGSSAFSHSNIAEVVVGEAPTGEGSLGTYAFESCDKLRKLTINAKQEVYTSTEPFRTCANLRYIYGTNILGYGRAVLFSSCAGLDVLLLDRCLHGASAYAVFSSCANLAVLHIKGAYSFVASSCNSLKTLFLKQNSDTQAVGSVKSCTGLRYICYDESVTLLDAYTNNGSSTPFYGCTGVKAIYFKGATPPSRLNNNRYALPNVSNIKVYCPTGSEEAYRAAIANYAPNVYSTWTVTGVDPADMPYIDENDEEHWTYDSEGIVDGINAKIRQFKIEEAQENG